MQTNRLQTALLAIAIVAIVATSVVACPTCKDGLLQGGPAQQRMATGYFYSILFMMSMPFVVLGTFGSFAYFSIRKARLGQHTPSDESPSDSH